MRKGLLSMVILCLLVLSEAERLSLSPLLSLAQEGGVIQGQVVNGQVTYQMDERERDMDRFWQEYERQAARGGGKRR